MAAISAEWSIAPSVNTAKHSELLSRQGSFVSWARIGPDNQSNFSSQSPISPLPQPFDPPNPPRIGRTHDGESCDRQHQGVEIAEGVQILQLLLFLLQGTFRLLDGDLGVLDRRLLVQVRGRGQCGQTEHGCRCQRCSDSGGLQALQGQGQLLLLGLQALALTGAIGDQVSGPDAIAFGHLE
jgi:hypothetical protein